MSRIFLVPREWYYVDYLTDGQIFSQTFVSQFYIDMCSYFIPLYAVITGEDSTKQIEGRVKFKNMYCSQDRAK